MKNGNIKANGRKTRADARRESRGEQICREYFHSVKRSVETERRPVQLQEKTHGHARKALIALMRHSGALSQEIDAARELMEHLQVTPRGVKVNFHGVDLTARTLKQQKLLSAVETLKRHAVKLREATQEKITSAGIISPARLTRKSLETAQGFTNPPASYAELAEHALRASRQTHIHGVGGVKHVQTSSGY